MLGFLYERSSGFSAVLIWVCQTGGQKLNGQKLHGTTLSSLSIGTKFQEVVQFSNRITRWQVTSGLCSSFCKWKIELYKPVIHSATALSKRPKQITTVVANSVLGVSRWTSVYIGQDKMYVFGTTRPSSVGIVGNVAIGSTCKMGDLVVTLMSCESNTLWDATDSLENEPNNNSKRLMKRGWCLSCWLVSRTIIRIPRVSEPYWEKQGFIKTWPKRQLACICKKRSISQSLPFYVDMSCLVITETALLNKTL